MDARQLLLVVDDDPAIRKMLAAAFAPEYDLILASNGQEAIQCCQAQGPGIAGIITDMKMPVLGGKEFLAWLDRQADVAPILIISGNGAEAVGTMSLPRLRLAFLPKPFRVGKLLEAVRTLLG